MTRRAKTLVVHDGKVAVREYGLRDLVADEVLVRAEYTCISPGTELRCMRLQAELHSTPYIPGYALVGVVEASTSSSLREGTRVYCGGTHDGGELRTQWGGHCEAAIAQARGCVPVPDGVEPLDASLTALGGIAYHGLLKSKPRAGERALAMGLGVLGQLSARLHALAGVDVIGCDLSTARVAISAAAGIPSVVVERDLRSAVRPLMPAGASLILDATGVPAAIREAIDLVQEIPWTDDPEPETRYLVQGSYAGDFAIPYQEAFFKQLTFILPRNRQRRDHEAFLRVVGEGRLKVSDLIARTCRPGVAADAYEALRDPEATPGTLVFDWST